MSIQASNETRSANYRAGMQRRDDLIMWADVVSELRDTEDRVAELLKECSDPAACEILAKLEDIRGIAGARKLESE